MLPLPTTTLSARLRQLLLDLWRIVRREPIELAEILWTLQAFCWGLWLVLPFRSMSVLATQAGAALNATTEVAFGLAFLALAALKFTALALGSRSGRLAASGLLLIAWAFVAYQFHTINPFGTGVATYGFLMLVQMFLFARLVAGRVG
jgi:hypothetical protein